MKARVLEPSVDNIRLAATALRKGDLVAMPTETVYGLGGGIFLPFALARIFDTKERPTFDPLIVHVDDTCRSLAALVESGLVDGKKLKAQAIRKINLLIEHFWPGPLTLVLPKTEKVPDLATSGLKTVGIRMPRHPVAQALIRACGMPIAAPSANRFGSISPTSAPDVEKELGDRIPWILDGGRCEVGVESTVLLVAPSGALTLLRPGGIAKEAIEQVTSSPVRAVSPSKAILAPGQTRSHYSPRKPLTLLRSPISRIRSLKVPRNKTLGFLILSGNEITIHNKLAAILKLPLEKIIVRALSPSGDFQEMAFHLFSSLRQLDQSKAEILFAEPCQQKTGIGFAIADRLNRAAAPKHP